MRVLSSCIRAPVNQQLTKYSPNIVADYLAAISILNEAQRESIPAPAPAVESTLLLVEHGADRANALFGGKNFGLVAHATAAVSLAESRLV